MEALMLMPRLAVLFAVFGVTMVIVNIFVVLAKATPGELNYGSGERALQLISQRIN